ncbi:hypothetical protein ACFQX7_18320 [Luedemannella flava]
MTPPSGTPSAQLATGDTQPTAAPMPWAEFAQPWQIAGAPAPIPSAGPPNLPPGYFDDQPVDTYAESIATARPAGEPVTATPQDPPPPFAPPATPLTPVTPSGAMPPVATPIKPIDGLPAATSTPAGGTRSVASGQAAVRATASVPSAARISADELTDVPVRFAPRVYRAEPAPETPSMMDALSGTSGRPTDLHDRDLNASAYRPTDNDPRPTAFPDVAADPSAGPARTPIVSAARASTPIAGRVRSVTRRPARNARPGPSRRTASPRD